MARIPRLSQEHVRRVHREVEDPGPGARGGLGHFTEGQYDEHLAEFLRERPEGPLGVFAYGSLIWQPAFALAAGLRAVALGWERAFTLRPGRFRGRPDRPGLMMQIDRGGRCEGVLHILPPEREREASGDLWRREMTVRPPGNLPRWVEVGAQGRARRAIAFTVKPESPNYAGRLSLGEVAACLSEACGHWGTGADHLLQTVAALEGQGIHDPPLWALHERVAELIEARLPGCFQRSPIGTHAPGRGGGWR